MRNKVKEEYKEAGGRCKGALWLFRHRCTYDKARGWRCKYCDTPYIHLRKAERGGK